MTYFCRFHVKRLYISIKNRHSRDMSLLKKSYFASYYVNRQKYVSKFDRSQRLVFNTHVHRLIHILARFLGLRLTLLFFITLVYDGEVKVKIIL